MEQNGLAQRITHAEDGIRDLREHKASKEALAHVIDDLRDTERTLEKIEATLDRRLGQIEEVVKRRELERQQERELAFKQREEDRATALAERRSDEHENRIRLRWMIGTALTCTGLLIAAAAVLLPAISGGQ